MRARPTGNGSPEPGLQWISAPEWEAASAFLQPDLSCWYSRNWSLAWLVACSGLWLLLSADWCWHDFRNKRQIEMAILYCRETSGTLEYTAFVRENQGHKRSFSFYKDYQSINQVFSLNTRYKSLLFFLAWLSCHYHQLLLHYSHLWSDHFLYIYFTRQRLKLNTSSGIRSGVFSHPELFFSTEFPRPARPFVTTENQSDSASFSFPLGLILYFPFQSPAHDGAKTSSRGI